MKLTEELILRAVPTTNKTRLKDFVRVFNEWSEKFGITTRLRTVHFLAQCWHESCALRYLEEIASGAAYDTGKLAVKLGNTPQKDGDGQKYKGRGIIQITGRANYAAYEKSGFCNGKVTEHPEWLAQSPGAYKSAMWFWWKNGLNKLADTDDVNAVTRRVNGGLNHLQERTDYLRKFKAVLK